VDGVERRNSLPRRRWRSSKMRAASSRHSFSAMPAALPKPTMPGTLSVPERMPRSWPAAVHLRTMRTRGFWRRT
jgi:hypothetical protein